MQAGVALRRPRLASSPADAIRRSHQALRSIQESRSVYPKALTTRKLACEAGGSAASPAKAGWETHLDVDSSKKEVLPTVGDEHLAPGTEAVAIDSVGRAGSAREHQFTRLEQTAECALNSVQEEVLQGQ